MASPVAAAAEEVENAIGSYHPENITELREFFADLPDFFERQISAFQAFADHLEQEQPLEPAVAEHYREMLANLAGIRDHVQEGISVFESAHERELQRLEEPRPNEQAWDVTQNS